QLLTEDLLLALLAGAGGLFLSYVGVRALIALAPGDVPRLAGAGIVARVLMFTLVASFVACLGFGLAPAVHATRVDTNAALKQSAAWLVGDRSWMRAALGVSEIALSVVPLVGAGLLIRSFAELHNVALGFRPDKVLILS